MKKTYFESQEKKNLYKNRKNNLQVFFIFGSALFLSVYFDSVIPSLMASAFFLGSTIFDNLAQSKREDDFQERVNFYHNQIYGKGNERRSRSYKKRNSPPKECKVLEFKKRD